MSNTTRKTLKTENFSSIHKCFTFGCCSLPEKIQNKISISFECFLHILHQNIQTNKCKVNSKHQIWRRMWTRVTQNKNWKHFWLNLGIWHVCRSVVCFLVQQKGNLLTNLLLFQNYFKPMLFWYPEEYIRGKNYSSENLPRSTYSNLSTYMGHLNNTSNVLYLWKVRKSISWFFVTTIYIVLESFLKGKLGWN